MTLRNWVYFRRRRVLHLLQAGGKYLGTGGDGFFLCPVLYLGDCLFLIDL